MPKRKKVQPIYIQCNECDKRDKYNVLATPGWRVGYTLICWLWLGKGIAEGNAFFISLGMLVIPLLIEYFSFTPQDKARRVVKVIQIICCLVFSLFAILGAFDCLIIAKDGNNLFIQSTGTHLLFNNTNFKLQYFYYASLILVVLTVIDCTSQPKEIECILKEKVKFQF